MPGPELNARYNPRLEAMSIELPSVEEVAKTIHENYFDHSWASEDGASRACMLQAAGAVRELFRKWLEERYG